MTHQDLQLQDSLEIFIDELHADEEFRNAFVRRPRKTLRSAGEWCLALTDSELYALVAAEHYVYDQVERALRGEERQPRQTPARR